MHRRRIRVKRHSRKLKNGRVVTVRAHSRQISLSAVPSMRGEIMAIRRLNDSEDVKQYLELELDPILLGKEFMTQNQKDERIHVMLYNWPAVLNNPVGEEWKNRYTARIFYIISIYPDSRGMIDRDANLKAGFTNSLIREQDKFDTTFMERYLPDDLAGNVRSDRNEYRNEIEKLKKRYIVRQVAPTPTPTQMGFVPPVSIPQPSLPAAGITPTPSGEVVLSPEAARRLGLLRGRKQLIPRRGKPPRFV